MTATAPLSTDWWPDVTGPVDVRTRRRLRKLGREVVVAQGTTVIDRGDRAERFHLVREGTVVVEVDGKIVASLGPGDFFGEVAMLYAAPQGPGRPPVSIPRTATVRAVTPTVLHELDRGELMTFMDVSPRAASKISRQAVGRLAVLNEAMAGT